MKDDKNRLWTASFTCAFLANFITGFCFLTLMPTLPFYLAERFQADAAVIGLVVSCYIIAALLARPFSSYLVDGFSRKAVYVVSYVLFVATFAGYILADSTTVFFVLRLWHGAVWGVITTAGATVAIDIMPPARRGEGIGYFGLAGVLAMAVGPLAGMFLYERWGFLPLFCTFLFLGTAGIVAALLIRTPARPLVRHQALSWDRFIVVKAIPIGVNFVLAATAYGMVLSFAAVYGREIGVANTGLYFLLMAFGTGGARVVSGKMIDGGRLHRAAITGGIIFAASLVLLTFSRTASVYFLSALATGIGGGILFPVFQAVFVNMVPHSQRGTANSTYFTALDLGVGGGIYLAGEVADLAGLSTAFGIGAAASIVSVLYYIGISMPSYRKNTKDISPPE